MNILNMFMCETIFRQLIILVWDLKIGAIPSKVKTKIPAVITPKGSGPM